MNEFPGIVQQRTTDWVLKRARLHYLSTRGDKSKTKVWTEPCSLWNISFSLLPSSSYWQPLAFFGLQVHHFNLCLHCQHHLLVSLVCLLFFKGHRSHWSRVYSQDLILTWLYPQRLHFQIRAHPLIQGTRISVYLLMETQFNPCYL